MKRLLVIMACCAMPCFGSAVPSTSDGVSVTSPETPDVEFTRIDTNKDGGHTADEIADEIIRSNGWSKDSASSEWINKDFASNFQNADTDGDSKVSRAEFVKFNGVVSVDVEKMDASRFATADTNQDGFHTLDEVQAESQSVLKNLIKIAKEQAEGIIKAGDKNRDEKLSPKEWEEHTIVMMRAHHERQRDEQARRDEQRPPPGRDRLSREQRQAQQDEQRSGRREDMQRQREDQQPRQQPQRDPEGFARVDANKDGFLSASEIGGEIMHTRGYSKDADDTWTNKELAETVKKMDANDDGKVDWTEFEAAGLAVNKPKEKLAPEFAARDTDKDGFHTLEELVALQIAEVQDIAQGIVKMADSNMDGKVSDEEDEAFFKATHRQREPPREEPALVGDDKVDMEQFASIDTDKDGKHSAEEIEHQIMLKEGFINGPDYQQEGLADGFTDSDTNHDGKVDKAEFDVLWKKQLKANPDDPAPDFDAIDTNKDGFHTMDEIKADSQTQIEEAKKKAKASIASILEAADLDKDGKLSIQEGVKHRRYVQLSADFDQIDKNKDGKHSQDEIVATIMANEDFIPEEGGRFVHKDLTNHFSEADADRDGVITEEEFLRRPEATPQEFQKRDTNGDGKHTLQEQIDISSKEEMESATEKAKKALKKDDADKNGSVEKSEFVKASSRGEL